MWTWLGHIAGTDDPSGFWYLLWSGLGGDLIGLGLIGAILAGAGRLVKHVRQHGIHIHHHHHTAEQPAREE